MPAASDTLTSRNLGTRAIRPVMISPAPRGSWRPWRKGLRRTPVEGPGRVLVSSVAGGFGPPMALTWPGRSPMINWINQVDARDTRARRGHHTPAGGAGGQRGPAVCLCPGRRPTSSAQMQADRRPQERLEMRRGEGEALLSLADAATAGRASSDFSIGWTNDFFKAQTGTFVPFTVTIDRSALTAADALMYVRATRRDAAAAPVPLRYPFDVIFPVALSAPPGQPLRI